MARTGSKLKVQQRSVASSLNDAVMQECVMYVQCAVNTETVAGHLFPASTIFWHIVEREFAEKKRWSKRAWWHVAFRVCRPTFVALFFAFLRDHAMHTSS